MSAPSRYFFCTVHTCHVQPCRLKSCRCSATCHPPPPSPPLLLPGQLCTASSTTHFVIWGCTIDSTGTGGLLYWEGHSSLCPSVFHIPHSIETLTHACTHTHRLRLPAFCSVLKTPKQKPHTHVFPSHMVFIVYIRRGHNG